MSASATGENIVSRPRSRFIVPAVVLLVFAVVLSACPLWVDGYQLGVLRDGLIFALLALSLDFLWGKGGILSFGQGAFFGLGAYAVAILGPMDPAGNGFLAGLAGGLALAAVIAAVVGYFLLYGGVRGPYLTIVTLALSLVAQRIATGWADVTGGDAGLLGAPPPGVAFGETSLSLTAATGQYILVVAVLLLALAGVWAWCSGRRGRVLAAIQDNELKARSLGHDTAGQLLAIFVLSAGLAALAGALYASVSGFVAPDLVGLLLSTQVIVWVAAGGRGTLLGPIVATVVILRLQTEVSSISYTLWPMVLGAFFIALVFLFPEGVLPFLLRIFWRLAPRSAASP
jgi:urea transport system permease protein